MISNRHISKNWNTFLEETRVKPTALCGARTIPKYMGIPGTTYQPRMVENRPGWCQSCIDKFIVGLRENINLPMSRELKEVYAESVRNALYNVVVN